MIAHRVGLVSCSKLKRTSPCSARELYSASSTFRMSAQIIERTCDSWYVLSALHGVLEPQTVISPYDEPLGLPVRSALWATLVRGRLLELHDPKTTQYLVLAGRRYAAVTDGFPHVEEPLRGLGTGLRRRWLARKLAQLDACSGSTDHGASQGQ